jgi:hypothetical protein
MTLANPATKSALIALPTLFCVGGAIRIGQAETGGD